MYLFCSQCKTRASHDVAHLSAIFPVIGDGQNDNRKLIENIFDKAKIHVISADKNRSAKDYFLFVCKMYYEQVLDTVYTNEFPVKVSDRLGYLSGLPPNRATASG